MWGPCGDSAVAGSDPTNSSVCSFVCAMRPLHRTSAGAGMVAEDTESPWWDLLGTALRCSVASPAGLGRVAVRVSLSQRSGCAT